MPRATFPSHYCGPVSGTLYLAAAPSADLTLTVRLFDHTAMTLVDKDDFDNDTLETWNQFRGGTGGPEFIRVEPTTFFSAPYAVNVKASDGVSARNWGPNDSYAYKSFTPGAGVRCLVVMHIKRVVTEIRVNKGGTAASLLPGTEVIPRAGMPPNDGKWHRMVIEIPIAGTTEVAFRPDVTVTQASTQQVILLDEVWVVKE